MGKNVADVVVGMLSDVGSATRPPSQEIEPVTASASKGSTPAPASKQSPAPAEGQPGSLEPPGPATAGSISAASAHASRRDSQGGSVAPRTLRLRPQTAGELRAAWLSAKREDVLLTAQDFASDLVEEALRLRHRRQRATNTA